MLSFRSLVIAGTATLLVATSVTAFARHRASPGRGVPLRIRGTVTAVADGSITIKARDGRVFTLKTGAGTTYADVVPASLDEVKVDEYIGTAVKGARGHWVAVEIVLVPTSMRAGRKADYPWDPLPDTSGIHATGATVTTMTNGAVTGVSPAAPGLTNTTMTNGTVAASDGAADGRTLTVALVNGQTARILVSAVAPITRFVPVERSAVPVGAATVVWTKPGNQATLVAAGRGVTPPM